MNQLFKTAAALVNRKEHQRLLDPNNWETLTRKEKRVAIALDVLRGLISRQYDMLGGYGFVTIKKRKVGIQEKDAQEELTKGMECGCCEVGALLLSHVYFTNGLKVEEVPRLRGAIHHHLKGIYKPKELMILEACYEGSLMFLPQKYRTGSTEFFMYYKRMYSNFNLRALEININIVQNNGEFIPAKPISHEHK